MILRWLAITGALLAAVGVGLGAFGAHGLENWLRQLGHEASLTKRAGWFDTAVTYQLYHALGLLAVSLLANARVSRELTGSPATGMYTAAGVLLVLGIALFSGSLYTMTFASDAWRKLGMITPLGGLAFIVGWICLAAAVARH